MNVMGMAMTGMRGLNHMGAGARSIFNIDTFVLLALVSGRCPSHEQSQFLSSCLVGGEDAHDRAFVDDCDPV